MKLYHVGVKLNEGIEMIADFKSTEKLIKPFITALNKSEEVFDNMMLQGRYFREVMRKSKLREWSNCCKWGTEAIFEYVRKNEFPYSYSRITSNYFYDSVEKCEALFKKEYVDSGDDDGTIKMFEVEVNDENPQAYDMSVYDVAYEAMENESTTKEIINIARKYWSRYCRENKVIETVSDKKAIIKKYIKWSWENISV